MEYVAELNKNCINCINVEKNQLMRPVSICLLLNLVWRLGNHLHILYYTC